MIYYLQQIKVLMQHVLLNGIIMLDGVYAVLFYAVSHIGPKTDIDLISMILTQQHIQNSFFHPTWRYNRFLSALVC